jgi:hypothetical protein
VASPQLIVVGRAPWLRAVHLEGVGRRTSAAASMHSTWAAEAHEGEDIDACAPLKAARWEAIEDRVHEVELAEKDAAVEFAQAVSG